MPSKCAGVETGAQREDFWNITFPPCIDRSVCGTEDADSVLKSQRQIGAEIHSIHENIRDYDIGNTTVSMCSKLNTFHDLLSYYDQFVTNFPKSDQVTYQQDRAAIHAGISKWMARETMTRGQLNMELMKEKQLEKERREQERAAAIAQAENERKLKEEKKRQAAEAKAKAEADKKALAAAFEQRLLAALAERQRFFVSTLTAGPGQPLGSVRDLFSYAYLQVQNSLVDIASREYEPTAKGEFETSDAYKARIQTEEKAFLAETETRLKAAQAKAADTLKGALQKMFGRVRVAGAVYDADQQVFSGVLVTPHKVEIGQVHFKVPLDVAPQVKQRLTHSDVILGFDMSQKNRALLDKAVIVDRNAADPAQSNFYDATVQASSVDTSTEALDAWLAAYTEMVEKQKAEQAEKARQEREAYAKRYPYTATVSCNLGRLAICLGKDGQVKVRTAEGADTITSYSHSGDSDVEIPLSYRFEVLAQNGGSRNRVLSVTISETTSGKVVWQDATAEPFGVLRASN
ncbi:hypothetical protein GCM10017044_11560 [Kordiimonas sediminis]|uniref:Uncharacterized protein n=1 Tax=Kordiimonas sediminis TaxID=1735581 RepID=A0A919E6F7_9PROT|nr:hypothetical protein [Kordiimonas sediminis]GHF18713.1 hypothetical protein GCM10017044_11560 [Kordiimonas sediminis]